MSISYPTSTLNLMRVTPILSGGTVTTSGNYKYHTFTSDGTLTVTRGGNIEVLVVGGGGGGHIGGGGAGDIQHATLVIPTADISVTVGAGGAHSTNGNASSFGDYVLAVEGGGGANTIQSANGWVNNINSIAGDGACGGGGAAFRQYTPPSSYGANQGGIGVKGNDGGVAGSGANWPNGRGGGGGGMGTAGGLGDTYYGGVGGDGINTYATWASATSTGADSGYYCAGGGGGYYGGPPHGNGGLGGGGGDADFNAVANTGSGGGGRWGTGGNGGSGVVIVRYVYK